MFKQLCKNLIDSLGVNTLIGTRVKSILDFIVTDNEVTNYQIKELQNETVINTDVINKLVDINNFATSEFSNCTEPSHKATASKIYITEDVQKIPIIRSITIKISETADESTPTYIVLTDKTQKVFIGKSKNSIIQTENRGKFVTWHFDYLSIPSGQLDILFTNENNELCPCRLHAAVKVEGVICVNNDVEYNNICPALGINTLTTHD